ncbi:MAG: ribonuclease E/G [Proteobacteria bacterium]|nr:ribonuclease E/G [Pseudomonadota bacterium]
MLVTEEEVNMAENKENDSKENDTEKKIVQIKATTGAWWKSTTTAEAPQVALETIETKKAPARKRSPRPKRSLAKQPEANQSVLPPVTAETIVLSSDQASGQEQVVEPLPVKSGRKRPPRKRQGIKKIKSEENVEDPGEKNAGGGETAELLDVVAKVEEESGPRNRRPAKSGRGRRGRRGSKKPVLPEESSQGTENISQEEPGPDGHVVSGRHKQGSADENYGDETFDEDDLMDEEPEEDEPVEETPHEEVKRVCKLLINAEEPEECRLALLEDGRLESIHVSTISRTQTKNNIYKARIVAIEPSLQAAFVDYGTEKNGFLPFSEIHPEYYRQELSNEIRHLVETHQWKKLNITDVIEKGQEILAQVVKEEVGKKGANMTTYLSIPGRCVVLMPGSDSSGISRRISGEEKRSQLRGAMNSIDLPEGIGWIVRTASVDINEEALSRDVKYLMNLWEEIKRKGQELKGVGLVYEDQESVLRFLREHFDPSIEEILVDDRTALEQVKTFVEMLPEKQRNVKVRLHQGARPIFNQYSIEDQIESIYQPQVSLPSGGSIVINPTEALVAIDVNSGSTSKGKNFEASIFQANMEAAAELARQLRLRDLGGLIVVDFIDMRNRKHIMAVEKKLKDSMKKDKAKVDFSRISKFGLMQISRQKLGAPIEAGNYRRCEHCKGRGTVRSVETLSLYYLRRIQTGASRKGVGQIECHFPIDVASYLLNNKRSELHEMEKRYEVEIVINARPDMKPMDNDLLFHKAEKEVKEKKQA